MKSLGGLMLGHLQDWQNRLLPAASDYLPTVSVVYLPVLRRQSLCRKPEHLMSVFPSFGRWERSSWKQQSLPHSLVPAKKAVACQNSLHAFFASQILPLPLAGTTWTPPLIPGQQNSALPTHCFEPAVGECIMMGER